MNILIIFRLTVLLSFLSLPSFVHASVIPFINEIHYDNEGSDLDEGVEIAGEAGFDLNGWSLELYNGLGGASYGTIPLSGIFPNAQNGYGTIFFPYLSGIQNGSPDGLALIDPLSQVTQFLSYEGIFSSVGGPADGMMSVDIGVEESSSTPIGYSLQLAGKGKFYEDFNWDQPSAATLGLLNANQIFISSDLSSDPSSNGGAVIPEPGSLSLLGLGFLGLIMKRRKLA